MLREVLPKVSRIAVFWDALFGKHSLPALEHAAKSLELRLISIEVPTIDALSEAIKEAKRNRADAAIFVWAPHFYVHRNRVAQLTAEARFPAIHAVMQVVEAGGFLSYGPDGMDSFRRVAYYADRILKGAKPAELPVEQVSELKLAVNLQAAKAMGIVIPESILARADKVVR